jgi:hypothetical protein
MKRTIFAIALLTVSSTAFATGGGGGGSSTPGKGGGCGWGAMVFEDQSGLGPHLFASTTNGTSGNATFGLTSGTNGCDSDVVIRYGGTSIFASIMPEFSEDVARGNGEALDTVAVMYGVDKEDRPAFAATMHENFAVIFPNENVTAEQAIASIDAIMKADPRLAKYVA